ncbi:MAG: efflux RND transporter periplasmic adaptor subunit [Clostridia bacterium]|nr:efflux RND transporter periplasmic adaptor subunit [Clostridia bacterium]
MKKKTRHYLSIAALLLVLPTILSGCMYFMPGEQSIYAPPLEKSEKLILPTVAVMIGDLRIQYDKEAGEIVPDIEKTQTVECEILGVIDEVFVKAGDLVTKGQLVAVLDMENINNSIFKQEIAVEKATMSYDRQLALYKAGKSDYYSLEFSRLSLEALTNYLNDLYITQKKHYLYASTDGIVVEVKKFSEDSAKGEILSICPKENFLVEVMIPSSDYPPVIDTKLLNIKSGKENNVGKIRIIYDGEQSEGYVFRSRGEYSLAYDFFGEDSYVQFAFYDLPDNAILGKNATVRYVESEAYDVMVIPVSTVYTNSDGTFYTMVVVGDEIEVRPITLGISDGVFYEVTSGLVEGERVLKSK